MIFTSDPVRDAQRYEDEQDRLTKLYMKGAPWCVVCDEPIMDPRCYVLDPYDAMESCVCKECMDGILGKMRRAKINVAVLEWFAEQLEYGSDGEGFERETPHKEVNDVF